MGACMSKTPLPTAAPWSDLPLEIAGLVFCRLLSHGDRLSFGAVCSRWRLAAREQSPLPPVMPCINLGYGAYQSLVDGKVRRFPTPKGYRAGASFGGWLFYYHEGSGRCFLCDPFSDTAIKVPTHYQRSLVDFPTAMAWALRALPLSMLIGRGMDMKMVVCSSGLIVAIFRHPRRGFFRPVSYLASFRPAQLQERLLVWSFVIQPHDHHHPAYIYTDIAVYHGKVFALSCWEELFCHDGETAHLPIVYHDIEARPAMRTNCYLVVSSNKQKLLMVRWRRRSIAAMDLWVFEADFDTGRWREVNDLGDQVLFLSRNCSMAFAAGSTEHWGQRFRGGNRVFVLGAKWARTSGQPVSYKKRDSPTYCVYDMVSRETSLVSLKGARYMESCTPGWFFPHE